MKKLKDSLELFLLFFKIGLFTFGGGYAMISLITHEVVEKKKFIDEEEFSDVVAIAESTPGPIAINSATYIGYKRAGVLGSIAASIGVVLPSLIIIYLISLFLSKVLEYPLVQKAFLGIQCGVSVLIVSAGVKLLKNVKKNLPSIILLVLSFLLLLTVNYTTLDISTIYFVIVGAIAGIALYYRPKKHADNRPIGGDLSKNAQSKTTKSEQSSVAANSEDKENVTAIDNVTIRKKPNVTKIVVISASCLVLLALLFFGGLYKFGLTSVVENLSQSSFYKKFLTATELFATFFKVGLFSFGGGYGMLPLMLEETVGKSWITEAEFANFLAIAESTPGPISINMATYVGSTQCGLLGSAMATLGAITPSFIVILLIVAVFKNFLENKVVRSALTGMKPVICGMILATGVDLALTNVFPQIESFSLQNFSAQALAITAVIALISVAYKRFRKKNVSPIILIVISAGLGMLLMV